GRSRLWVSARIPIRICPFPPSDSHLFYRTLGRASVSSKGPEPCTELARCSGKLEASDEHAINTGQSRSGGDRPLPDPGGSGPGALRQSLPCGRHPQRPQDAAQGDSTVAPGGAPGGGLLGNSARRNQVSFSDLPPWHSGSL